MTEELRAQKPRKPEKPQGGKPRAAKGKKPGADKAPPKKKGGIRRFIGRMIALGLSLGLLGAIAGVGVVAWVITYYSRDLPDYHQLESYNPDIVTRVYAGDGRLLTEFAKEKRVFLPIEEVPQRVINAFLAAEDKSFYEHPGVDLFGIANAVRINIQNFGKNRRPVGASTITQQVAKNFLLSSEVSYERKIKEAILAFHIEKALSKDEILELYLNQIYLGGGSYGVVAAALDYFDKSLNELSIEEAAYLAALPKAPNNYHPVHDYEAAVARRNYVIEQMAKNGFITEAEADIAMEKPLETTRTDEDQMYFTASYFAEEIRRRIMAMYGEEGLYRGGLLVHSTIDPTMQGIAARALRNGLVEYDKRHGLHRPPVAHFDSLDNWSEKLDKIAIPAGAEDWRMAVILDSGAEQATIGFTGGKKGVITLNKMKWARKRLGSNSMGPAISRVDEVLKKGDVVLTEPSGETVDDMDVYWFRQIPEVQGGIIAMDPHTGRVLALVGGFSYEISEFNRATQAKRQPGSAFKPIVYLTALEAGFTPATMVLDAPFVYDQGPGKDKWRPSNYSNEFYGPTPLRVGVEKSRNLMTVRLANYIGMEKIAEMANRLGAINDMDHVLSMALGAGETTLLDMIKAYSVIVNGGKKVHPTVIDRIQNRDGRTIYVHDGRPCEGCGPLVPWKDGREMKTPVVPDTREQLVDPRHAYQMVSIMEGVVQRGTGRSLRELDRPLAGKTGTTNDAKDAWFIGYTPDLVVGAYVGFDEPRTLGKKETGGRVAAPVVKEFFAEALKDVSPVPFRQPRGIKHVRIDAEDGTRAEAGDEKVIWEAFLPGTEPGSRPMVFDGTTIRPLADTTGTGQSVTVGTGGLY